jgi:hypothetical protein
MRKKQKGLDVQKIVLDSKVRFLLPFYLEREIQEAFTFINPEYKALCDRRRLPDHERPDNYIVTKEQKDGKWSSRKIYKFVYYWEYDGQDLVVPRGAFFLVKRLFNRHGLKYKMINKRVSLDAIDFRFTGALRDAKGQNAFLDYTAKNGILQAGTGCLTGETILRLSRGGRGFKCSLKKAYHLFNKLKLNQYIGPSWKESVPTKIRSYDASKKRISLNIINDIVYSGLKVVYQIYLKDGKKVKGTKDHKILTSLGWKQLGDLTPLDLVATDQPYQTKTGNRKQKGWYKYIHNLPYHPFRNQVKQKVLKHIIIYESGLNNLKVVDFINILQTNQTQANTLKFVNTSIYCIHHKDHDHFNNKKTNLKKMKKSNHSKLHFKKISFNQGQLLYSPFNKRIKIGKEPTYDVQCKTPNHNFTANDIVVHNSGKTVMALSYIARVQQPTIIVVDTNELLQQWKERINQFLGIPATHVGHIGGGRETIFPITVALVQTLRNRPDLLKHFGFLCVDECHIAATESYSLVVNAFNGAYVMGLSATPRRRDGRTKVMLWYLGRIALKIDATKVKRLPATAYFISSRFEGTLDWRKAYSKALVELTQDETRGQLIIDNVLKHIDHFGVHLILSRSSKHLEYLMSLLPHHFRLISKLLVGKIQTKERQKIVKQMMENKLKFIFATDRLLGKGFDEELLSVLHLATPVKDPGALTQYCGRVTRIPETEEIREQKSKALIFYYFDTNINVMRGAASIAAKTFQSLGIEKRVISNAGRK